MMTESRPEYLEGLLSGPLSADASAAAESAPQPVIVEPNLVEVSREFPRELLDQEAVRVVRRLTEGGHRAYLVGGCVRDLLFGLRPKDFDVVTSAEPAQIKKLFRNCRIIGRRFRLAHIYFRDKIIEVATFRAATPPNGESDGQGDGELIIRDDNVFGDPESDAVRRDFTVNALFYDVDKKLILDYVGGVQDAEARMIRTIGNPHIRLREDPIRMLRAVRLAARIGCAVDDETIAATRAYGRDILDAAAPRIHEDLQRMFSGGAMAPAFDMLLSYGVLEVILPELTTHLREAYEFEGIEELESMRSLLQHADRWTQAGRELSPAVRMALLLAPVLLTPLGGDTTRRDAGTQLTEALRPIAQRLSISKKECERVRQVLVALGKMVPRAGKRRRFSVAAFVKRAYFPDALDFFELITEATGELRDEAERWRKKMDEFPAPPAPEKPKRPRRRRPR